ncbi:MAG: pyrroloquinoline quinone biosynthesis peptide chaperone PqqD [Pseudonocardiaceae bacterium]|nr:MAG: pyrroloquinoline quinone biosynthesis peptide chaperone PqqD [Pseudonocardiaceae bacterium]
MRTVESVRLARHVRLRFDAARGRHVLLGPETVAVLNATSADVLALCDGRTVDEIVAALRERYDHVDEADVRTFLERMAARRCLEVDDGR